MRLLVGFSGGVDSTALLAALAGQRPSALQLRALHVNHGLHPDADQWSRHCRKVARDLKVPLRVVRVTVQRPTGVSLEEAAREARYAALAKVLAAGEVLLTAHHLEDQLETVLLQLFRGAGLRGLAAMPEKAPFASGWLVRPLLHHARSELQKWVRTAGLPWIDDATNDDDRLYRNHLRKNILPLIKERWPGVALAVSRSARHAAEAQRLLDTLARADVERAAIGPDLSVKVLRRLPADRRRNALRFWIVRAGARAPDSRRLDELAGPLIDARPDAQPRIAWPGAEVERHGAQLCIRVVAKASGRAPARGDPAADAEAANDGPDEPLTWEWRARASLPLPEGTLELKPDAHGPINLDALPPILTIRRRRGGERMRVSRGGPRRALKSLLQEARVPIGQRASLPLLFAGEVLLAAGELWVDESIRAARDTLSRGRLRWVRRRH